MGTPALAFFGVELKQIRRSQLIENPQSIGDHLQNKQLQLP